MFRATTSGVAFLAALMLLTGCENIKPQSAGRRVATRTDLIGGPSALGEMETFSSKTTRSE